MPFVQLARRFGSLRMSWLWLILGVGLVYGLRLNHPEVGQLEDGKWLYSYDENYTVLTARRIAEGDPNVWSAWQHPSDGEDRQFTMRFSRADLGNDDSRYEWVHPPTPRVIMAGLIRRFGMNAAVYRVPSVIFGVLTVLMVWVIGNRMRGPGFGLYAAVLTASDGWIFCLSRVGMTDIYLIGSVVTSYAAFYVWWTAERRRGLWMLATGTACGVALSMKWSAAAPVLGLMGLAATRFVLDWRRGAVPKKEVVRHAALAALSFTLLPAVIYFASYWPFFSAGHPMSEWVSLHKAIVDYNRGAPPTAPGSRPWYLWPVDRSVTWFVTRAKNGACQYTFASSNWIVWYPIAPALVYAIEQFTEDWRFERAFVSYAGAVLWLPYALVHRFVFTRYFALVVPFGALAIAAVVFDLVERSPPLGRALRAPLLIAAVAFFVLRYPVWAGVPLPCRPNNGVGWTDWLHVVLR